MRSARTSLATALAAWTCGWPASTTRARSATSPAAWSAAGLGADLTREALQALGFWVCDADLEDELIRALGVDAVERIVEAEGELAGWRTFRKQPAQRAVAPAARLRRFIGTRSGRKIRYGRLLVEALDLAAVPPPLDHVLAHV